MSTKSNKSIDNIAVIGIDISKNSFHVVGHDERGKIVLRQKRMAVAWRQQPIETDKTGFCSRIHYPPIAKESML